MDNLIILILLSTCTCHLTVISSVQVSPQPATKWMPLVLTSDDRVIQVKSEDNLILPDIIYLERMSQSATTNNVNSDINCICTITECFWQFVTLGSLTIKKTGSDLRAVQYAEYNHSISIYDCVVQTTENSIVRHTGQLKMAGDDGKISCPIELVWNGTEWMAEHLEVTLTLSYLPTTTDILPVAAKNMIYMLAAGPDNEARASIAAGMNTTNWSTYAHHLAFGIKKCSENSTTGN